MRLSPSRSRSRSAMEDPGCQEPGVIGVSMGRSEAMAGDGCCEDVVVQVVSWT